MRATSTIFLVTAIFLIPSFKSFGFEKFEKEEIEAEPDLTIAQKASLFKKDSFLLKRSILSESNDSTDTKWIHFAPYGGISMDKVRIWGNVRFLTIYRNMSKYYPDMITGNKNFSFSDYPLVNAGAENNNGSVPMVEMTFETDVTSNLLFAMGYSYAHTLSGVNAPNLSSSTVSSRSNLWFGGHMKSDNFAFSVDAGQVLWTRISKFTMGQPIYRDDYFDRLPWDWYRSSFARYKDYYDYTGNLGPEGFGRSPIQGFVMNADVKSAKLSITGVYGRTNRNLIQANAATHFPSITYVSRIQKGLIGRAFTGKLGLNLYDRHAYIDRTSGIKDEIQLASVDFEFKKRKWRAVSEFGIGRINNPQSPGNTGFAADVKADFSENMLVFPLTVELYHIDVNVVSLDGSILNSNTTVRDGGYANQPIWDNMSFINIAQEVGQVANNRNGLMIATKKSIGNFKAELGYSVSQEIKNIHDTITIQHRINAFSRSRFRPWFQSSGPYARIKSGYYRTFETIAITDAANGIDRDYKKGFNSFELLLKYKGQFLGKDFILLNFINYNSIQDKLAAIPGFSDKAFVRTFYNNLTAAYAISTSYTLVGEAGIERVIANSRTILSSDNAKPINQTGYGFGLGIDYDFHKQANLHLRQRWMYHRDENFKLDQFAGTETYLELKIFI